MTAPRQMRALPQFGDEIGLDRLDNLLLNGRGIVFDYRGTEAVLAVNDDGSFSGLTASSTPFVIDGYLADATGAVEANTTFTWMARRACGLDADGNGTVQYPPKPVWVAPGSYLLRDWRPTDSNGDCLPINFQSHRRTAKIRNALAGTSNTSGGGMDLNYDSHVERNKIQAAVTAVALEFAPTTFGVSTSAAGNDEICTSLTVADATIFKVGALVHVVAKNCLPHTKNSGNQARVGETARVVNTDATKLYLDGRLCFADFYENEIYVTQYDERRTAYLEGLTFESAPTTIGLTTATPSQLDHGLFSTVYKNITSLTQTGGIATVVTENPHLLTGTPFVTVSGAINDTNQGNYNITAQITVTGPSSFTYPLSTQTDANGNFSITPPSSVSSPATGTPQYREAYANLDTNALGACLTIRNAPGVVIKNCDFRDPWTMAIRLYNCPEWWVDGVEMTGGPNAGTAANSFNSGRLGYGLSAYGHSCDGLFSNSKVRNFRHVFTTDAKQTGYTPTSGGANQSAGWNVLGVPCRIVVQNIMSQNVWGIAYDLHEEGSHILFDGCKGFNPQRGPQGGSYTGMFAQVRCRQVRFKNCYARGGSYGIRLAATEQYGVAARYSSSSGFIPLTFTISSFTQAAGVGTFIHGAGSNTVNAGAHIVAGETMVRFRLSDMENYNFTGLCLTYDEATKTGTVTLPTKDDLGATFATAPASAPSPATGAMTLQVFARAQHIIEDCTFEGLLKGKDGALWLNSVASISWKNEVHAPKVTGRDLHCVINAEAGTRCTAGIVMASGLVHDGSSDQSGAVIGTQLDAYVHVGFMSLDCSNVLSNAASVSATTVGIFPARCSGTPTVHIGILDLTQHSKFLACPTVFKNKDAATPGKKVSLGKLLYHNPGQLTSNFHIIDPGQEANFTWLGGGEEIFIPIQTAAGAVTNSSTTVAERLLGTNFILRRAMAMTDANAVGNIDIDVHANDTTIFGTNKVRITAGSASSVANTPTYSTTYFAEGTKLELRPVSSSGSETAKCYGVTLSGFCC